MFTTPLKPTPHLAVVVGLALVAVAVAGTFAVQRLASRAGTALQSGVVGNAAPSVDAVIPSDASGSGSVALPAAGFTLNEGATRNLYVRGTVSDPNGCADLNGVALTVYRPGVAYGGTDGMNATDLIGQATFDGNVTNYQGSITARGMFYPFYSVVDTVGHRLFVTDYGNNRVLEFDLNADNTPVDATADHVLGQADFTHGAANRGGAVAANTMRSPIGVAWDAGASRLFVADAYNHRVLSFDLASGLSDGMAASHVLGQASLSGAGLANRGGTVTAGTLNSPLGLFWDDSSSSLLVADANNNRVTVFGLSGGLTDGMSASHVLGQADFTHGAANRGGSIAANTLSSPVGFAADAVKERLFVSDLGNHRILSYGLTGGLTDGMNASHVLGQADFTHGSINRGGAITANTLYWPYGLAWDAAGSRLMVADSGNSRVLAYEMTSGIVDGMGAGHVLGQANLTQGTIDRGGVTNAGTLHNARGVSWDAAHSRLTVADSTSSRLLFFDLDAGSACASDANNCYMASIPKASLVGCTGAGDNDATFETAIPVVNFADPTDAGSPYDFESWQASAVASDVVGLTATLAADFEVQSLAAFAVAPSLMDYGTIALGATSSQQVLIFTNTGNRSVNSNVRADGAMRSSLAGFADIASVQAHYSTAPAIAWSSGTAIGTSDSDLPLLLPQQQADAGPAPTAHAYFYLKLPATGIRGTYTNTLFFTAYAQ